MKVSSFSDITHDTDWLRDQGVTYRKWDALRAASNMIGTRNYLGARNHLIAQGFPDEAKPFEVYNQNEIKRAQEAAAAAKTAATDAENREVGALAAKGDYSGASDTLFKRGRFADALAFRDRATDQEAGTHLSERRFGDAANVYYRAGNVDRGDQLATAEAQAWQARRAQFAQALSAATPSNYPDLIRVATSYGIDPSGFETFDKRDALLQRVQASPQPAAPPARTPRTVRETALDRSVRRQLDDFTAKHNWTGPLPEALAETAVREGGMLTMTDGKPDLVFLPGTRGYARLQKATGSTPQQFRFGDVEKLQKAGALYKQTKEAHTSFQDGYAGSVIAGELQNFISGRVSILGPEAQKAASWWQFYDGYKNEVRHGLFGATLTANEREAFERASVNPNMAPGQIRRYLEFQRAIQESAMARRARALIAEGYNPRAVEAAYGTKITDLRELTIGELIAGTKGFKTPGGNLVIPPSPSSPPPPQSSAPQPQPPTGVDVAGSIANAKAAIARNPAAAEQVRARLRQNGIDPALLDRP